MKSHKITPRPKNFNDWLDQIGTERLSKKLNVCTTTIYHWKTGHCEPRVAQMREIKKMTRGLIGYDQIIDGAPVRGNNERNS